jgi:hypothetical protein
MPSRPATWAAMLGQRSIAVNVATVTRSMSAGCRPAAASAFPAAAVARSVTDSVRAMWRVAMPVRRRIQVSSVSTSLARSSLVSTSSGW